MSAVAIPVQAPQSTTPSGSLDLPSAESRTMPDASSPARWCTSPCNLPSVPQLAVSALLRHHRGRKGLTIKAAGQLVGIPASHVSQTELMQRPVTESLTRSLLTAYCAPAEEVQQAADLVALAESVHLTRLTPSRSGAGRGWRR